MRLKRNNPGPPVHSIDRELLQRRVDIALIGCGGNGSQMLTKLARLNFALRELGHPEGLRVHAFDPDKVSRANIGRQLFSPADVGQHKAEVLVNRINAYYGLEWIAHTELFDMEISKPFNSVGFQWRSLESPQIVISCVDTAKARREIDELIELHYRKPKYWLDLGSKKSEGQVILGQPKSSVIEERRLPTVTDIFPELLDPAFKEDDEPSCSLADALNKQSLFVNDHITDWAMQLLDTLFRKREIEHHGAFINLETGKVNPLPVPRGQAARLAAAA